MAFAGQAAVAKVGLQLLLEPSSTNYVFRPLGVGVGCVYPAYMTYKAVKGAHTAAESRRIKDMWLKYWAVWGTLTVAERLLEPLLTKFPWWYHCRFAALVWLQLRDCQGAALLFDRHLRPLISKYEPKVDVVLDNAWAVLLGLFKLYETPITHAVDTATAAGLQVVTFVRWFLAESAEPRAGGRALAHTGEVGGEEEEGEEEAGGHGAPGVRGTDRAPPGSCTPHARR